MRVPWTAWRSNQSILKEINPDYTFEGLMLKEKEVTEDEMVGWHCQLNGHKYMHKLWETVKDREAWHASVHEVTKSWT